MMNKDRLTVKEKTELPEDSDKLNQGKKQNEDLKDLDKDLLEEATKK